MTSTPGILAAALIGLASTASIAAPVDQAVDNTDGIDPTVTDTDHAHSLVATNVQHGSPLETLAEHLLENANHASATGNPLAHGMAVTQASPDDAAAGIGNNASATGNPLAQSMQVTQAGGDTPMDVAGGASAYGGFGTGPVGHANSTVASGPDGSRTL